MFSRFFIHRPIFASVLSIIVTLGGSIALFMLPIAQYPEITPPTVEVSASYPGADAQMVADTVAAPIEQQVNGVEGMMYMSSQCTNDGTYTLTVTFKLGVDLNMAQVLVQNRVAMALPILPDLVNAQRRGGQEEVAQRADDRQPLLAADRHSRDDLYLSNYATIQLRDELARLPGVGDITYLGQRDYSMRLWLDPEKMSKLNLTASDVVATVQQQNAQVAAGQIGQPPVPSGQVFQYTMTTLGRLVDVEQFADMTIKTDAQGRIVRVRDVARIELGAQGYDQTCTLDGRPSVALSVYQLPGTNALKTAKLVRDKMEELKQRFPEGLDYSIVYDTTPFITESISEVFLTLIDAVLLVAFVVLLFLQNWRSAIIPLVAVPVAVIGTFAVMAAMGFSLNNLTLFGLVLAIGIVVDDAIVVVEAVRAPHRGRPAAQGGHDQGHEPGLRAGDRRGPGAQRGVRALRVHQRHHRAVLPPVRLDDRRLDGDFGVQLADAQPGACRAAVAAREQEQDEQGGVLPIAVYPFLGGGLAYRFLMPWADATLRRLGLAGLEPASRRLLAPAGGGGGRRGGDCSLAAAWPLDRVLGFLFRRFNVGFAWATEGYTRLVGGALRVSLLVLVVYGGLLYLTYWGFTNSPSGFIPMQDKGYLLVNIQLPDAASVERTERGHAAHRGNRRQDRRRQAHRGHRRPVDPAGRQRAELRRDVRHARRFPRARPPAGFPARRSPPRSRPASRKRSRTAWWASSGPRRSTAWARPAASRSSSRTAATRAWPPCRRWARRSSTTPAATSRPACKACSAASAPIPPGSTWTSTATRPRPWASPWPRSSTRSRSTWARCTSTTSTVSAAPGR